MVAAIAISSVTRRLCARWATVPVAIGGLSTNITVAASFDVERAADIHHQPS
jgi:hypothetical protein